MIRSNYHTHTHHCDGEGEAEDYVRQALDRGLTALGFSGHTPLPFPNEWTMDEHSLSLYLQEIRRLQERYSDKLEIYLGLETDYLDRERNPASIPSPGARSAAIDYQIGSVHMLPDPDDGAYYSLDGPVEELEHLVHSVYGGDFRPLAEEYYRRLCRMAELGGFEILGHFDLLRKHNGDERYFSESESWYRHLVEESLNRIARTGITVEINTGAMARGYTAVPYPSPWILDLCADRSIPITINADAHKPHWVDYSFTEARRLALSAGYGSIRVLRNGRWIEEQL
jgi:histidinol-phosphatase (PHP family)